MRMTRADEKLTGISWHGLNVHAQRSCVNHGRIQILNLRRANKTHVHLHFRLEQVHCTITISKQLPHFQSRTSDNKSEKINLLARSTPGNPYALMAYKNGLPIPTPLAPKHSALMISVARLTPPSM